MIGGPHTRLRGRLRVKDRVGILRSLSGVVRGRLVRRFWDVMGPITDRVGPTVELDGVRVYVDPRFGRRIAMDLVSGDYEESERQILSSHLVHDDIVMELGAGIGVISAFCAQRVGSARVFAYEGNPALERHIRRTYALNHVSPTCEMCLIGEHDGEHMFHVADDFWSSSSINKPRWPARSLQVPVKSFNREVERIGPSVLIIDIEGGEHELCRYADFLGVQKILLEVHEWIIGRRAVEHIRSCLADAGFTLTQPVPGPLLFAQRRPHVRAASK